MPGVCPERERRATGLDPMKTLARMIHEVSSRGRRGAVASGVCDREVRVWVRERSRMAREYRNI